MIRKIIEIDDELCNGCGICVKACHEGAIGLVDGKAKLLRDDYCDGLGDCLPTCPTGAISFVHREADAYDEEAVMKKKRMKEAPKACPGTLARIFNRKADSTVMVNGMSEMPKANMPTACPGTMAKAFERKEEPQTNYEMPAVMQSKLSQWPVQIKLAPVNAPFFKNAKLLIAADCSAYAYANMHNDFIKGHITLIGCPKLDNVDYSEKLGAIIKNNDIRSVHIVRMEVPCCGGLENAVKKALQESGKFLPWQITVISTDGRILD